jgi:hypothetical protein
MTNLTIQYVDAVYCVEGKGLSASIDSRDRHRRRMFAFLFLSLSLSCVVDMDIENIIVRVKEIASAVSIPRTTVNMVNG